MYLSYNSILLMQFIHIIKIVSERVFRKKINKDKLYSIIFAFLIIIYCNSFFGQEKAY